MSDLYMDRTWMVHDTGSKYYQVITIHNMKNGRICTTVNYGATKGDLSETRPVRRGETLTYFGNGHAEKVSAKTRRGYSIKNDEVRKKDITLGELTTLFGATKAEGIKIHLGISLNASAEDVSDEPHPIDEPEDTPIDKFADRPAAWGCW